MDLFTLVNFAAERSTDSYLAVAAAGLPFNIAHAAGNFFLCLLFGPGFVRLLRRFKLRLSVTWGPAPPATLSKRAARTGTFASGALLALLTLAALPTAALGGAESAIGYLERSQNRDGGYGGAPGQGSNQLLTGWATIGLEAGGRHPLSVRRGGRSPIDYLRRHAGELRDTGELERTILVLRGAGLSARRFAGRDLVQELLRRRQADGAFGGQVNHTAFAVLALRATGADRRSEEVRAAVRWLGTEQGDDGGFAFSGKKGASDVDDTGSVLQALAAAGRRRSTTVTKAIAYLRRAQRPDGGFGQLEGTRSNAQSTAWAVQGLVACGRDPDRFGANGRRSPLAYLRSLQQTDGSFRYSRTSTQTPIWVTAQAVAALRRKPLPLRPLRRPRAGTRDIAPSREGARRSKSRRARPVRAPGARPTSRSRPAPVARKVAATGLAAEPPDEAPAQSPNPVFIFGLGVLAAAGVTAGLMRLLQRRRE